MADRKPLYRVVQDALYARLESGEYAPGSKLPREADLAEEFKTTVPTVRRALDLLKQQGFIYSINGVGSFAQRRRSSVEIPIPTRAYEPAGGPMTDPGIEVNVSSRRDALPEELRADVEALHRGKLAWGEARRMHEAVRYEGTLLEETVAYEFLDEHGELVTKLDAFQFDFIVRMVRVERDSDLPTLDLPEGSLLLEVRVVELDKEHRITAVGYHRYPALTTTLSTPVTEYDPYLDPDTSTVL